MVFEKVAQIIAEQLGMDSKDITMDTEFDEINADSLELVGVIMAVEQEFGIEVDDEDIESLNPASELWGTNGNAIKTGSWNLSKLISERDNDGSDGNAEC